MYRKDRRIMGLLYVFDVDGLSPGSNVILVWIDHKSDRQFFDYNTKVNIVKFFKKLHFIVKYLIY